MADELNPTFVPAVRWTDDCQGKKNYDGALLRIDSRYWPKGHANGAHCEAVSGIHIQHGAIDGGGESDYSIWRERWFKGPTEADVRAAVEAWVAEQFADLMAILGVRGLAGNGHHAQRYA